MKKWLLIAVLLGIIVLALIVSFGFDDVAKSETYTIVGLFPLTGSLNTLGQNSMEIARLAARDVNTWLEEEGKDWRLDLKIEDTATDHEFGLHKMQVWHEKGVQFFVGPQSSTVVIECLPYANENQILFISPSSTSPDLAIPDDYLFRFCTTDALQGPAIAKIAKESGANHVIFSWRDDNWGYGLQDVTTKALSDITVYPKHINYDLLEKDFSTEASLLNDYVSDLVAQGAALNEIALVLVAYEEEATPYIAQAAKYDQLKEIIWIGSDATATSETLLAHPVASQFAADVQFLNPVNMPAETPQSRFNYVRDHIQSLFGRETDSYSYNTYDIVWALALSLDEVGYDTEMVKEFLPGIASEHTAIYGASGHVELDDYGDRAYADYDLWLINANGQWENVGCYDGFTGQITWNRTVY